MKLGEWDLGQELGANQTSHTIFRLFLLFDGLQKRFRSKRSC